MERFFNWAIFAMMSGIMLDIKFIRENKDVVAAGAAKKRIKFDVEALLAVDDKRRALTTSIEAKKAEQNQVSDKVIKALHPEEKQALIDAMKELKKGMQAEEEELKTVMHDWQLLMVQVPNIPDMSVPEGETDADNQEIRVVGEKPDFAAGKNVAGDAGGTFTPKSHIDLMLALDMADFERGTKVAGFRGYFLKNDGARLNFALWKYALDFFEKDANGQPNGSIPMIVPSLVNRQTLLGTGYLPQGEEDLYKTQDGDYLAGTGEVATMSYYSEEIVDKAALPIKVLAFSPCFRREAGSHGKDTKGLMRVHEFYKFEQVILCEASHEQSVKYHEEVNANIERFVASLKLPYHTVVNCGGDLGLGQVKKYDTELWIPSENAYREIGSASYFHDFQSRRLNIRYRDDDGKLKFVHSLNSTAIPTPRALISIIENYQNTDGSITVPEVLRPYMGKDVMK